MQSRRRNSVASSMVSAPGFKKAIEGGLHDCRLARAWALGGRFQPFDNLFGESHADFSLHRRSSLELDCAFAVVSDRMAIPLLNPSNDSSRSTL